ncbi:fumarylacetoacetate hydrolase family protein [Dactylosporangium fulvum]
MRIARLSSAGYAYAFGDDAWVTSTDLGLQTRSLESVASALPLIRSGLTGTTTPAVAANRRYECPVTPGGSILGIGLNYHSHIKETGRAVPSEPSAFGKLGNALSGPFDDIIVPTAVTTQVDYECELAVVVGRPAHRLTPANALSVVLGYCVANDVTARDLQQRHSQVTLSKSIDTFCPMGPYITTADEIADPQDLQLRTYVNGELRQDSSTRDMVFSVADLISRISASITLRPGDVILTGTPAGVGFAMNPATYLADGDVVRCEIEGLGHIENRVVFG